MTEMSPAEAVFFAAAALPPAEREAYLSKACAGNEGLRQRVEQMLAVRPIVGDFLEAYVDADTVLCSVCTETKTIYVRQQWLRVWEQVVRQIQQQESANEPIL